MGNKEQLYHDIGIVSFVLTELSLYLDTHPTDREAMDYLSHYVRMKNQAMPLNILTTITGSATR